MSRNTIIKIKHKEYPVYMATRSEAKKYFLKFALENRNKEQTYAEDIRRFSLEELIWFVYGGNTYAPDYEVYYYKPQEKLSGYGKWKLHCWDYEKLFEREKNPFTYKVDFIYRNLMH